MKGKKRWLCIRSASKINMCATGLLIAARHFINNAFYMRVLCHIVSSATNVSLSFSLSLLNNMLPHMFKFLSINRCLMQTVLHLLQKQIMGRNKSWHKSIRLWSGVVLNHKSASLFIALTESCCLHFDLGKIKSHCSFIFKLIEAFVCLFVF